MRWLVTVSLVLTSLAPHADPLADLRALCAAAGHDGRWLAPGELQTALTEVVTEAAPAEVREVIKKVGDRRYCFDLALSNLGEPPTMVISRNVLWEANGTWHASPNPDLGPQSRIVRIPASQGGRELIIADEGYGSGQFGQLVVLRRTDNTWATAFKTGRGRFRAYTPDDDHILITGIGETGPWPPLAWTGNCCLPSNHQWLYERNDSAFVLTAERDIPDPYITMNIFFGALLSDQPEVAERWLAKVAAPAAVSAARQVGFATAPQLIYNPALPEIQEIESRHWDLLPPEVNGPAPGRRTLKVLVGPPGAELTLERQAEGWRVTGVRAAAVKLPVGSSAQKAP